MSTLLGKIIADFETTLASKISVGGTSATLQSNIDDDGVALPNGLYFLTLDADDSTKEYFFAQITGTAITSIQSVSRQGVLTTGAARTHRVGGTVSITDFANLKIITDYLTGVKQLDSTLPLGYDGAPSSLTGNQLATVTYVLSVVTGGTVAFSQQSLGTQLLGETVALRAIVYLKSSDQRWYNVSSATLATYDTVQLGVCLTAGVAGGGTTIAISGPVTGYTGLTAGALYYADDTAGTYSTTPGTAKVAIGIAQSTTVLLFNPQIYNLPTSDQNDALAGSNGTPSSSNKYLTQGATTLTPSAGLIPLLDSNGLIPRVLQNAPFFNTVINAGSGTQNIAHGMAVTPRKVRVTAIYNAGTNTQLFFMFGAYDGTHNSAVAGQITSSTVSASSSSTTAAVIVGAATGVITVTSTNIVITWTGTPSGIPLLVEAE